MNVWNTVQPHFADVSEQLWFVDILDKELKSIKIL